MNYLKLILTIAVCITLCEFAQAQITITQNTSSPGRYDLYELSIVHPEVSYTNVWEQVSVYVNFSSPANVVYSIDGFYFNTDMWKVRFAPPETGAWSWTITFTTPGDTYMETGTFNCLPSATKGFLKIHPSNPNRLVYADDSLFNGIGIGDCINDGNNDGSISDQWGFDGDFRPMGQHAGWDTTLNAYMNAYGKNGAGFNLFRWSVNNCAFNLYQSLDTTGNRYAIQQGLWGDTIVQALRQNGIRLWLTLFSWNTPFQSTSMVQPAEEEAVNRYIKYVVARYGAYVDIWELNNETTVTDRWITFTTSYLQSIDPFHRLISNSWERPFNPDLDITSPHWYEKESEFDSDVRTSQKIVANKQGGKLLVYGEQGNSVQNWDTLSALRMRLRSWTAFFEEGIFIFWNTSGVKDYFGGGASNIYLGPQERGYIRILQNFTALADTSVRDLVFTPSNPLQVRAYGLRGTNKLFGYFHHYSSHTTNVNSNFTINAPLNAFVTWIDPASGNIVLTEAIGNGIQTITTPSFMIDLAMIISPDSISTNLADQITEQTMIRIYPNPAQYMFTVELPDKHFELVVGDMFGRIIYEQKDVFEKTEISCNDLSNGIYMVQVTNGGKLFTIKVIVSK